MHVGFLVKLTIVSFGALLVNYIYKCDSVSNKNSVFCAANLTFAFFDTTLIGREKGL